LPFSDAHRCDAVVTCVATRRSTASRLNRRPVFGEPDVFDAHVTAGAERDVAAVDRDEL